MVDNPVILWATKFLFTSNKILINKRLKSLLLIKLCIFAMTFNSITESGIRWKADG